MCCLVVFFFKQKTAYEMRISDWSSDVCSSDLLAASTHPGEEKIVGETQRALKARLPGLITLLAPRHPHRAGQIRRELEALGLVVAQRSRGEPIDPATDVYLADSIGELGLWYRLAEVVFVGGSLVAHGGQNLLEPAKLDCAILAGPHPAKDRKSTRP